MKRRRIPVFLSLIVIAIAAVAQTATSQTRDERAIRAASDAWQRYIVAQQVDSIVGLFTPDAGDFVYLPPNQSHFGHVHGVTIVQVNGRAPFEINPGAPK